MLGTFTSIYTTAGGENDNVTHIITTLRSFTSLPADLDYKNES